VAIALQPADLAFVRVEVFQPELGCIRMRRVGADRLHIDTGDNTGLRHDDVDGRVALQRVAAGERVVVPGDEDRGLALGERRGLADDRNEIAGGLLSFLKKSRPAVPAASPAAAPDDRPAA
jgi:hypothetical protein